MWPTPSLPEIETASLPFLSVTATLPSVPFAVSGPVIDTPSLPFLPTFRDGVGHIGLTGPAGTNGVNGTNGIDLSVKPGYDDPATGVKGEKGVDGTNGLTRIGYTDGNGGLNAADSASVTPSPCTFTKEFNFCLFTVPVLLPVNCNPSSIVATWC